MLAHLTKILVIIEQIKSSNISLPPDFENLKISLPVGKVLYHFGAKTLPGVFKEPNTLSLISNGYFEISDFFQIPQFMNLRRFKLGCTPQLDFQNFKITRCDKNLVDIDFSNGSIVDYKTKRLEFRVYSLPQGTELHVHEKRKAIETPCLLVCLDGQKVNLQTTHKTIVVFDISAAKRKTSPETKKDFEYCKHLMSSSPLSCDHEKFHFNFAQCLDYKTNRIHAFLLYHLYSNLEKIGNKFFWFKKYRIIFNDRNNSGIIIPKQFTNFGNIPTPEMFRVYLVSRFLTIFEVMSSTFNSSS